MKYNVLRRYVDILMYLIMCFVVGTGLLIGYRLAPCSRGGDDGYALWGLGRHDWGTMHLWAAYALLSLSIVHLVLNFSFIKNIVAVKSRLLLAIITIAGASVVLWFLVVPIEVRPDGKQCGTVVFPSKEGCLSCPGNTSCNAASQQAPAGDILKAAPDE